MNKLPRELTEEEKELCFAWELKLESFIRIDGEKYYLHASQYREPTPQEVLEKAIEEGEKTIEINLKESKVFTIDEHWQTFREFMGWE